MLTPVNMHWLYCHLPSKTSVQNIWVLILCLKTVQNWSKVESISRKKKLPISSIFSHTIHGKVNLIKLVSLFHMEKSCILWRHGITHWVVLSVAIYVIYKTQASRFSSSFCPHNSPYKDSLTDVQIPVVNIMDQTSWLFCDSFFCISAGWFGFVQTDCSMLASMYPFESALLM